MSVPLVLQNNFVEINEDLHRLLLELDHQIQAAGQYSSDALLRFKERLNDYFGEWQDIAGRARSLLQSLPREITHRNISQELKQTLERCETSVKSWYHQICKLQILEETSDFKKAQEEFLAYLKKMWSSAGQLSSPLRSLQGHPLVKKFLSGERVYASRSQLQWPRKIFHSGLGLFGIWFYGYSGFSETTVTWVLVMFVTGALTTEVIRRVFPQANQRICGVLGKLIREREKTGLCSATWFMCAILFLFLIFPKPVNLLALFYTSFGDPAAGIVGSRWGRHKIRPHVSLEGSLACFLVCFVGTLAFSAYGIGAFQLHGFSLIAFSFFAALAATLAESLFKKFDDNLVVPLLSGPALWLLMKCFH